MDLARAFSGLARMAGAAFGGPYVAGQIIAQATPGYRDDTGAFIPGTPPTRRDCLVQIDSADWAMRQAIGFVEGTVKFIVLRSSFSGPLDTDARIAVLTGENAGEWLVSSLTLDPMAIGYVGQAKRA